MKWDPKSSRQDFRVNLCSAGAEWECSWQVREGAEWSRCGGDRELWGGCLRIVSSLLSPYVV